MKRAITLALFASGLLFASLSGLAQEKPLPVKEAPKAAAQPEIQQAKVQIVFTEYEGEKKVKSLPYTLLVRTGSESPWSKIRMGSRVPVYTGGEHGSMQYIDVGTNIDCQAHTTPDGRYQLFMTLERSWVEGDVFVPVQKPAAGATDPAVGQFAQPIIRQFRSDSHVALRDGQTLETNFATDPVSGKIIKLEVSLNIMK